LKVRSCFAIKLEFAILKQVDKIEYISRQFSKAQHKKYEHYVVTRIWHLLNDLSLKIVTQQYVTRPEGRAMTDLYFPQLRLHIEIDEGFHKLQIELDKLREADIVNATGHEILRVNVTRDIKSINQDIQEIIQTIRRKKAELTGFKTWDIEKEMSAQTYIDKGFIDLADDCSFRTILEALKCFGINYKGVQFVAIKHPLEEGTIIWFPKLYANEEWDNSISDDESLISEISKSPDKAMKHIEKIKASPYHRRIVFARVKSPLGDIMYRFKGLYEIDMLSSAKSDRLFWKKVSGRVKTYRSS
jgi:very-short-patch-repair endonuclease